MSPEVLVLCKDMTIYEKQKNKYDEQNRWMLNSLHHNKVSRYFVRIRDIMPRDG